MLSKCDYLCISVLFSSILVHFLHRSLLSLVAVIYLLDQGEHLCIIYKNSLAYYLFETLKMELERIQIQLIVLLNP